MPLEDQLGELHTLRAEGKIAHIGLSKVTPDHIDTALQHTDIAAVQNCLNLAEPHDPTLNHCHTHGIPYIAYRPLNAGAPHLTEHPGTALNWLLDQGDHVTPIPGTGSPPHLRQLVGARTPRSD